MIDGGRNSAITFIDMHAETFILWVLPIMLFLRTVVCRGVCSQSKIDVVFLASEWGSLQGGLSTFNREFAINLARKSSQKINVHVYVSTGTEFDKKDAEKYGVNLIIAEPLPGFGDPLHWLIQPPRELPYLDVVVGHGRKTGGPAHLLSSNRNCK